MATEDTYFNTGLGRCFQKVAVLARSGAGAAELASGVVAGLRNQLRKPSGPAGLASLATHAGVRNDSGRLALVLSADELEQLLEQHRQDGRRHDRTLQAELEARVVEKAWILLKQGAEGPRCLRDLIIDYCVELPRTLVVGRIEQSLGNAPMERRAAAEAIETELRELLKELHADIITSLQEDPSGRNVRKDDARAKMTTAEKMFEPLPVMPQGQISHQ